jgi:hypothetical protein
MEIKIELTENEKAAIQAYLDNPGMVGNLPIRKTIPEYLTDFVKEQIETLVRRNEHASS